MTDTKYTLKERISNVVEDNKTASRNFIRLVESVALIIVAGFTYLVATGKVDPHTMGRVSHDIVVGASGFIALRGAYEFWRRMANKD